ncbi:MAG: NADH-quinone oxidoreductase subunit N [Thermofilum sp.]|jgi:NADH-quinone oxidoreductase subunit N|nr:NADH-quinone oxidoreductase subunit N [Thermofilum sp.]
MLETVHVSIGLLALCAITAPLLQRRLKILLSTAIGVLALSITLSMREALAIKIAAGEVSTDWFTSLIVTIALADTLIILAFSYNTLKQSPEGGAFIATLLLSIAGLMGLSHSGTLLMLLTSWTLVSATSYALIALLKDKFSASGATKYGLMSLASSMLLLLSLAFISTQDKNLAITQLADGKLEAFLAALVFSSAALGFKAGIFPFHAWLPDTYGVSDPYPISIVAAISKSAVILAFYKLSIIIGPSIASQWLILIGALSVLTMTYANITALLQKGFQGLLAYSSIAHAGYILVGIAALTTPTAKAPAMYGLLMQLTTYTFAKTGLFLLAKLVRQTGTPPIRLEQLNGLSKADSTLAASALILVLSLMGIPPLVGFWGKFFLFLSVVGPATWLTATALINTGIAAAYYARVIKAMYFEPGTPKISGDRGLRAAIISSSVITLVAGLVPLFFPPP